MNEYFLNFLNFFFFFFNFTWNFNFFYRYKFNEKIASGLKIYYIFLFCGATVLGITLDIVRKEMRH